MAIRYYPLTRIVTNRYTPGNEYILPNNKPYKGRYYLTYSGDAYTGVDPVVGTNIPLLPIGSQAVGFYLENSGGSIPGNKLASAQSTNSTQRITSLDTSLELTELTPYYPVPIESDYQRGYFTRYFAKTVSGPGYVIEISRLDWTKIQDGNVSNTVLGYETVDMLWQLTGPLNNTRVSQYQVKGGVYDTNKRVTESKNKVFRGLLEFIGGDYTKFARITP